ncbi:DDT domain-containing protein PTM-like isoform X6 [Durio zibethinus]|uniref:DDT domain-containing protein PTM-like isoform X6 n=1 Tax=Durio zibethinus TaxID=66656 RepID=A0A6P5ZJD7_DURZI|nr:DDT domain-containing protein PTM-like isoform X6 [Durio zibethinus]
MDRSTEPKVPRPRGRPRKHRRPEEENENTAVDTKFNNSKTKKWPLETRSMALVGRYVLKQFGKNVFLGKIVSYDTGLYRVDYEYGNFEDLESGELRKLILEESYFDDDLSRRKVRLDELVLSRTVKESELEEKKKVEILKKEVDRVEPSALSELSGGMMVDNEGEQVEDDDADSSSDSCEHARDSDLSLEPEVPLIPPLMLPPSSGTIGLPEECVSHLFSVYGFLRSFSIILFLSPFGLDDFVGSLNCCGPNPLLDAVHVALMRALSCHLETVSSEGSELASKCLRCLDWSLLDALTWPVYLVQYFMLMGYARGPEWKRFYKDVSKREYYSLPVIRKLMVLQLLCDDVLEYAEMRAEIDMREAMEVGTDPDAVATDLSERGPRRVHPRHSKTSACKEREAMEIIAESHEVKSSSRTFSLGLKSTEGNAGVDADVDGNNDECRLCGMDGTLLCCDGCPSAYHSRCIGVMKMYIPEGPWYCPECAINKMGPAITINTSLRGAELFGVDLYGQVFLGTCNHLLVLMASPGTESYLRYYNPNDIPKILQLEENISIISLSADWIKLMDDWLVEPSVIQSTSSTVGLPQKRGPGGRCQRKQSVVSEVTANDSNDKSFDWWRGGKLSTNVFQKAILPRSMVRKAARQGGVRKISGINYVDESEIPKRSRQLIWRNAVERSKNTAQLALQVRYLDLHVRWNDLVRPEHNIPDGKGTETEASIFRNAIIYDKKIVESKIQYGVAFRNQKHLPSRVMKNIIDIEQTEDKKEKYWFLVAHIPLYLIKEYEERMSTVVLPSVKKPFSELSDLQRRQLKASRRNIFTYLTCKRDKLEKCSCASCQMDVLLRNAVKCGTCQGYCHQDCTLSSHMNGKVKCFIICKQCYRAKALAQNEINTKSPTTLLHLQGRDCHSAPAVSKGMQVKSSIQPMKSLAYVRSKENSVRIQERSSDTKKPASLSGFATKQRKCNWGVIWRKKNSDETGIDFRRANILTSGGSHYHSLKPICELCEQPYNSDLMYIHCETCRKWYHAEAVELEESRISNVVGFKCCKCRRIRGPDCPFMDPELREQKRKKQFGKPQKQGQGSIVLDSDFGTISDFKECNPITPIISTEDELVLANDPLLFTLTKVEQITDNNSEVDVELNTASGPGLQKLPVRRYVKREGEVDGLAGSDLGQVEILTCPEPNDSVEPKEDSSIVFAEWNAYGDILEGKLLDYESLNNKDMEFEPQTYFSFSELLASDNGDQVNGNDATGDGSGNWENASCSISQDGFPKQCGIDTFNNQAEPMNSDVNALHCHVCLQYEPAPDLHCEICGFLMHSHCSPWDESSSSEGSWRCGRCREWR